MYSDWFASWRIALAGGIIFLWLGFLSYLTWKQNKFLSQLFPKSGERDIRKKFEEVMGVVGKFKLDLGDLGDKLSEIEKDGSLHIQRVELLRYNPFGDTGGDQSFSAALLDRSGSGFIITSLHSRSGTRIFAKPVLKGRASGFEFSKEEEEVVKKAIET